jgi:hypothetical protein
VTIFEENEKLKETLVLETGAFEAKSTYYKDGVSMIPDSFLKTIVRWDKDVDESQIKKAINLILIFNQNILDRCFMTDIQYDIIYDHPQLFWGIFKDEEEII